MQDTKDRNLGAIAQLCRAISSQLRHIATIGKKLLSSNISSTCPHNMVNLSLLAAEIVSLVAGTPANFNGFRVFALLLQRCRSTEANQTLHSVLPLPGLIHYIYIFGGCCSVTEFCKVPNSLCVLQVLRSPIGIVTARQLSSGREPNFAVLSTGHHLPIFGRATITFGIGPHSSLLCILWLFLLVFNFCFLSTSQKIDREEYLRNQLFCVEWDVKP